VIGNTRVALRFLRADHSAQRVVPVSKRTGFLQTSPKVALGVSTMTNSAVAQSVLLVTMASRLRDVQ